MSILLSTTHHQPNLEEWTNAGTVFTDLIWTNQFVKQPVSVTNDFNTLLINPLYKTLFYVKNAYLDFPKLIYQSPDFSDANVESLNYADLNKLQAEHCSLKIFEKYPILQTTLQQLNTIKLLGGIRFIKNEY